MSNNMAISLYQTPLLGGWYIATVCDGREIQRQEYLTMSSCVYDNVIRLIIFHLK